MAGKIDRLLGILAGLFGLVALVIAWDLLSALNAEACGAPGAGADCYPWGAEGPTADVWKYSSKAAYLLSDIVFLGLSFAALIVVAPAFNHENPLPARRRAIGGVLLLSAAAILWL